MTSTREALRALLDERARAWENTGKPLADVAATREFTGEETEKWQRASDEFDAFGLRIRALELTLEQERAVAEFAAALDDEPAVRAALEAELRSVLVTRDRLSTDLSWTGPSLTRALAKATGAGGGFATADEMIAEIVVTMKNYASVLDAGARIITTKTGNEIPVPMVTATGAAAAVAEAANLVGTDPTFGQAVLKSYKFGEFMGVSNELIDDAVVDIESLIVDLIAQNLGSALGGKLATGTGTNETRGLFTAASVGKTGATGAAGGFTFDDLIDLHYSVAAPYRGVGSWIMADTAIASARKLKGTDGQYIWTPSVQLGQPDLILGRPVYGDAYAAGPAAGARSVAFGDISRYWVRIVNSLRVERSDHALFGSDQVAFRGVLRADGALTDASAVKVFVGGAE